jgi:signal peptidase II
VTSRWSQLALIAVLVLLVDQATKLWAVDRLTRAHELAGLTGAAGLVKGYFTERELELKRDRPVIVWKDHWSFKYVENPGAAWGVMGQLPDGVRVPLFHAISVLAIGFILAFFRKLSDEQRLLQLALSLVFGGALGNWMDRLVRGYVIDFIDWHWKNEPSLHWPTFNVADVAITAGVALMLAETLLYKRAPADEAGKDQPPVAGSPANVA